MKKQTRELLVITKAARRWHDDFDQKVEELMTIISHVDTVARVEQAVEFMDVYHSALPEPSRPSAPRTRGQKHQEFRPFEFMVHRN